VTHAAPARRAAVLLLLPLLAACGGTATGGSAASTSGQAQPTRTATSTPLAGGTSTPASTPTRSTPTPTGCVTELQITVKGTRVTPAPGTTAVDAGCEVRLTVTSDRPNELHVHVADLEKAITPGTPLTVAFTPEQAGVYEIELHDPELLLVKLAVR
jgi:hypothetical protein